MQGVFVLGQGHERQGKAKKQRAGYKPFYALFKRYVWRLKTFKFYAPGTHTQGLTPVSPKPIKEQEWDNKQQHFEHWILYRLAIVEPDSGCCDDEEQGN